MLGLSRAILGPQTSGKDGPGDFDFVRQTLSQKGKGKAGWGRSSVVEPSPHPQDPGFNPQQRETTTTKSILIWKYR